jgi:23S rRNA (guanosine2251-2'-O)-methyltransferase
MSPDKIPNLGNAYFIGFQHACGLVQHKQPILQMHTLIGVMVVTLVANRIAMGFRYSFVAVKSSRRLMHAPDRYLSNHRFWSETVSLKRNLGRSNATGSIMYIIDDMEGVIEQIESLGRRLDVGVVLAPRTGVMIPIHDGKLQKQHLVPIPVKMNVDVNLEEDEDVFVCGFSPRASHVVSSPAEGDRPVDPQRLQALNIAIQRYKDIPVDDLIGDEYSGTPPARIYRSFVAPRRNALHLLEPIERAANRTASQIDLAVRQVKADRASYLRNTDNPVEISSEDSIGALHRTVNPVVLVLDNVRSAYNVGSIFRSAETAGVEHIYTCGITAHPPNPKLRKTAMSAVDVVPSTHHEDCLSAVKDLKEKGVLVIALETTNDAKLYTDIKYPTDRKVALVVGNEVTGVDTGVIAAADMVAEIPTFGIKNSLNVAAALPVVLFEVIRQWKKIP